MPHLPRKEIRNLVRKVQQGDHNAFSTLYEATSQAQYYTALSILKDPDLAEDAIQTVYMKVYANLAALDQPANFLSWLSSITFNTCMYLLRGVRRTSPELEAEIPPDLPDPSPSNNMLNQVISRERHQHMLELLDELTPHHRTVILLRFYQGLKIKEIAMIMNTSDGTVRSRLHYALKKLQKLLREKGCTGPESIWGAYVFLSPSFFRRTAVTANSCSHKKKTAAMCGAVLLLAGAAYLISAPGLNTVRLQSEDRYINGPAKICITTKAGASGEVQASYENGEALTVSRISSGRFEALAPRNGNVLVTMTAGNCAKESRNITVSNIDSVPPSLNGYMAEGEHLTFFLSDDCSGVDLDTAGAVIRKQGEAPIYDADIKNTSVTIPYKPGSAVTLTVHDRAGNEGSWEIENSSEESMSVAR